MTSSSASASVRYLVDYNVTTVTTLEATLGAWILVDMLNEQSVVSVTLAVRGKLGITTPSIYVSNVYPTISTGSYICTFQVAG